VFRSTASRIRAWMRCWGRWRGSPRKKLPMWRRNSLIPSGRRLYGSEKNNGVTQRRNTKTSHKDVTQERNAKTSRDEFAAEAAARRVPLKRQIHARLRANAEPRVHSRIGARRHLDE